MTDGKCTMAFLQIKNHVLLQTVHSYKSGAYTYYIILRTKHALKTKYVKLELTQV